MKATKHVLLSLVALGALSACALENPTVPCSSPEDCRPPLACCTGSGVGELDGLSGPHCQSIQLCAAGGGTSVVPLPEGAPCGRGASDGPGQCGSGLSCCVRSLTCLAAGACDAQPVAVETIASAGQACGADVQCPQGVCCGIHYLDRSGVCTTVRECAVQAGLVTPPTDAGVVTNPDAGPPPQSLAEQICANSGCAQAGAIDRPLGQIPGCADWLNNGKDVFGRSVAATEACLDAVLGARDACQYLLRFRNDVGTNFQGSRAVLPGPCYVQPPQPDPEVDVACAKLVACGHVPNLELCRSWAAPLGYDALSRIQDSGNCTFSLAHLGTHPKTIFSRCRSAADCAADEQCQSELAEFGVCTYSPCDATKCQMADGICEAGVCLQTCRADVARPPQRAVVDALCSARIYARGAEGLDMACAARDASTGVCVGAPPASCAMGYEVSDLGAGRLQGALTCASVSTATLTYGTACQPSVPDLCLQGACLGSEGAQTRCRKPCVVFTDAGCDGNDVCISPVGSKWGSVGACYERCRQGACAAGLACNDGFPDRFCE